MTGWPVPNWCGCAPPNGFLLEAWFVRRRWEGDRCPCCGAGYRDPHLVTIPRVPIAEGVTVCIWCARDGHLRDSAGWAPLLLALVAAPDRAPA